MSDDRHDVIRARAYQLWEDEGRPDGREESHWHQASQEMDEASDEAASITEPALTADEVAAEAPARKPRSAGKSGASEASAPSKTTKPRKAKVAG